MKYEVKLDNFEGPLDLLLHLVSQAKIQIQDIFVSQITEQYLEYIRAAHTLDLEVASEFLQMAATLVYIKSRALLPRMAAEDVGEDGLTPEERLIVQLEEYKRYKEAAAQFMQLEQEAARYCYKLPEEVLDPGQTGPVYLNADVNMLLAAYQKALARAAHREAPPAADVVISRAGYSVKEQMKVVLARLVIKPSVNFEELLSEQPTVEEVAVTFLSLLELLHQGRIAVRQYGAFGNIHIAAVEENSEG